VTRYLFTLTFLILLILLSFAKAWAYEQIKIVTTLPFLKNFAEVIGGDRVEVNTLLTGFESEHTYTPKPSDILAVKEASILIKIGLGLETWVDSLITNAANPYLLIITTSENVSLLRDIPHHAKHAVINPHIWLDPEIAKHMLHHILQGLTQADPSGRDLYLNNFSIYIKKLDLLMTQGKEKMDGLPDRRIITHHVAWPYFAQRFGLIIEGNLIHQVGSEPSAKKLARLTRKIRNERIKVIVSEPQLNPMLPQILAEESGAKVVLLTPLPGAIAGTETYLSMIEYNINQLVEALQD